MPYDVDIEQLQALRKFRALMQSKGLAGSFKAESELSKLAFAAIELDIRKARAIKRISLPIR